MLKKILIFLFLFCFFSISSYANYDDLLMLDKQKTIKELKENIEDLDRVKLDLTSKLNENFIDEKIKSFLRTNMTKAELDLLEKIVFEYNLSKNVLELKLIESSKKLENTEEINKNLFLLRETFYKDILEYIDSKNYEEYLNYIKKQTHKYLEEKEIDSDIIKKSEIVSEKINNIEEKIKEHKLFIEETLSILISSKIDERINLIITDPGFTKLSIDERLLLIDRIIDRIKEMQNGYIIINYSINVNPSLKASTEKKIEICNMIIAKFEKLKSDLAQIKSNTK